MFFVEDRLHVIVSDSASVPLNVMGPDPVYVPLPDRVMLLLAVDALPARPSTTNVTTAVDKSRIRSCMINLSVQVVPAHGAPHMSARRTLRVLKI